MRILLPEGLEAVEELLQSPGDHQILQPLWPGAQRVGHQYVAPIAHHKPTWPRKHVHFCKHVIAHHKPTWQRKHTHFLFFFIFSTLSALAFSRLPRPCILSCSFSQVSISGPFSSHALSHLPRPMHFHSAVASRLANGMRNPRQVLARTLALAYAQDSRTPGQRQTHKCGYNNFRAHACAPACSHRTSEGRWGDGSPILELLFDPTGQDRTIFVASAKGKFGLKGSSFYIYLKYIILYMYKFIY